MMSCIFGLLIDDQIIAVITYLFLRKYPVLKYQIIQLTDLCYVPHNLFISTLSVKMVTMISLTTSEHIIYRPVMTSSLDRIIKLQ